MNENIGWVGGGRGRLFTPPPFSILRSGDFFFSEKKNRLISGNAFPAGVFTNIGRSAGAEGYYARNNNPCSVGFTLSLGGEGWRNNDFQVYKNFKYFKNQLKYDKTSRIKSNPSERKWRFSLLTSLYSNMEK